MRVKMPKYRVLVTGANGQLGMDVVQSLKSQKQTVYGYGRNELDVTDIEQVSKKLNEIKPNVVIHCAAHTKVDLAESEPERAFRVNAYGSRNIAVISEQINAKLVYVSTDYVFNGRSERPYNEFDSTSPMSVYGKSKLAGEQFVRDLHSKFFIVRTSWLYGEHGHNFVKTMLRLAEEKESVSVVTDQIGCPTYSVDLAECIADLIETSKYGIYHISNSGQCSWYEFAKAIFEETGKQIDVNPVSTVDFPRPASRPPYSVLDHMALRLNGFSEMRHWRQALLEFL